MTKRQAALLGSIALLASVAILLFGPLGEGAWVEPPEIFRDAPLLEDRTRVTRTAAGMTPSGPVRLAIRRRVYRFERPSGEFLRELKRALPSSRWHAQSMVGQNGRQTGHLFIRRGTAPAQTVDILVWDGPGTPATRVQFQELREATPVECGLSDIRRFFSGR